MRERAEGLAMSTLQGLSPNMDIFSIILLFLFLACNNNVNV